MTRGAAQFEWWIDAQNRGIDVETLNRPHLACFLPDGFSDMPTDRQHELQEAAHYTAANLPRDYAGLTADGKQKARKASLTSWFDPSTPQILCNNVDRFVAAMYLFDEYYLKRAETNVAKYFHRDPMHKYTMVRMAMSEPIKPTEPAKACMHAPRGSTKTVTLIHEMAPMIALVRPRTQILISEINAERTAEEILIIKKQIEDNELIHADFGSRGSLWQRSASESTQWTSRRLDFKANGSSILGYSAGARQRGRHPVFGIIDDPEDDLSVESPEQRRKFVNWLMATYLPMFQAGGKVLWIGTIINAISCLQQAIGGGVIEFEDEQGQTNRDVRFDDWTRHRIAILFDDAQGDKHPIFPDYMSLEGAEAKQKAIGMNAWMSEFMGSPMGVGEAAFNLNDVDHGWMHCKDDDGEYVFDCHTGLRIDYDEFKESLFMGGACDLGDSTAVDSDYSAVVVGGTDPDGVIYIVDVLIRRMLADVTAKSALLICGEWGVARCAMEKGTMQNTIVRQASYMAQELELQGVPVPSVIGISHAAINKRQRIISTLRPLFNSHRIRLKRFAPFSDANGVVHRPIPDARRAYHYLLWQQLELFTDGGKGGHDDGPDTLEMLVDAVLRHFRGEIPINETENERSVRLWGEAGVPLEYKDLPPEVWTEAMWAKYTEERERSMKLQVAGGNDDEEMDPYD